MYDAGKILIGLLIFLAIVTSPMWYHTAKGTVPAVPDPEIITDAQYCVESTAYMTSFHMDLLNTWRDEVVRNGDRIHISPDGIEYDKSLTRTCMDCHSNKQNFCDQCHNYAGVVPYCWDCHIEPTETQ